MIEALDSLLSFFGSFPSAVRIFRERKSMVGVVKNVLRGCDKGSSVPKRWSWKWGKDLFAAAPQMPELPLLCHHTARVVAKETCCCCCFADSVHPPLSLAASEPHLNQGVSGVSPGHESTLRHILFFHELGESTSLPGLQNKIQEAQYLKLRRFYSGHIYRKTIRLS